MCGRLTQIVNRSPGIDASCLKVPQKAARSFLGSLLWNTRAVLLKGSALDE
jgi:hypothetical protein